MKKLTVVVALFVLGSIGLAACGPSEADVSAEVDEVYEEYEASILAGDADRWVAQWTEDGVAMWPDLSEFRGTTTLLEAVKGDFDVVSYAEFEISTEEVQVAGDWAYARGTFVATLEMKEGGEPIPYDGKFLTIFERQSDGSWKIHRDIYNSNVP
jgi:uncharacterized protein (TIGR02246 family)